MFVFAVHNLQGYTLLLMFLHKCAFIAVASFICAAVFFCSHLYRELRFCCLFKRYYKREDV